MTGIQAVVFDFGGVISRTLFETHALSEAALELAPGTLSWRGPFDPQGDELWRRMQADEISERDYWATRTREVARLVGKDWQDMSDFVRAARGTSAQEVIRPEFLTFIRDLKAAGIRRALLSNELDLFYGAKFRESLPFLTDFELICDATYTKILKPDLRAYQECLNALQLDPAACLFIDDQQRNIIGAQAVGLVTVHFDVVAPQASYDVARKKAGLRLGGEK